jgi:hypothetical protein
MANINVYGLDGKVKQSVKSPTLLLGQKILQNHGDLVMVLREFPDERVLDIQVHEMQLSSLERWVEGLHGHQLQKRTLKRKLIIKSENLGY